MIKKEDKNKVRKKRHYRVRNKIKGTHDRPRLNVYRSLNNIYVQFVDDNAGVTLVSANTLEKDIKEAVKDMTKCEAARYVGKTAGERALAKGISEVVFDRGGYLYTGRVAKVAEGARESGLKL